MVDAPPFLDVEETVNEVRYLRYSHKGSKVLMSILFTFNKNNDVLHTIHTNKIRLTLFIRARTLSLDVVYKTAIK